MFVAVQNATNRIASRGAPFLKRSPGAALDVGRVLARHDFRPLSREGHAAKQQPARKNDSPCIEIEFCGKSLASSLKIE